MKARPGLAAKMPPRNRRKSPPGLLGVEAREGAGSGLWAPPGRLAPVGQPRAGYAMQEHLSTTSQLLRQVTGLQAKAVWLLADVWPACRNAGGCGEFRKHTPVAILGRKPRLPEPASRRLPLYQHMPRCAVPSAHPAAHEARVPSRTCNHQPSLMSLAVDRGPSSVKFGRRTFGAELP